MTIIEELKEYLKEKKYPLSKVAKAVNMSNATLHLWINNNYKGNVKKIEDAVSKFLEIDRMREKRIKVDFIKTSIVEDIFDIAQTCHVENEIGVCCGNAGIGKTFAVKKYAIEHSETILIEADLGYTPKVLFSEIHKNLGFDGSGTIHAMLEDIIAKLKHTGRLIIVDGAEHLPYKSLELLRRVYDKAQVGILLVGMPRLIMNLRGEKRQYAQLYSRVGISLTLNSLLKEDIEAIVSSVIPDYYSIYPTISHYCVGNTRVLTKLLARAIRIAELNSMEINSEVIEASIRQIIM